MELSPEAQKTARISDLSENPGSFKEPSPLQEFASNFWSGPSNNTDQSTGGAQVDRVSFDPNRREARRIPELPGVQTSLQGVTDAPKTEVTVDAKVAQILPDYNNPRNGLSHEQFNIVLDDGTEVFVAHDLNYAPRVPLTVGEEVKIKGEYIPTPDGENHGGVETIGVLHWTHHGEDATDSSLHQSGYIEAGGQIYQ